MRALVIGLGEVGENIARTLSAQRHEVTVVDSDAARVEAAQGEIDALALLGNGASPRFLHEIGAGRTDLLCAVTQIDEVNVIAALAGHQLGARKTVARVRDEDYFETEESFARDVLGIDFVVQPERATAAHLAAAIRLPGSVQVEHFAGGRVSVAETITTERSPLINRPLRERRIGKRHAVIALIREGRTVPAEPGHRLKPGDHLLVAAERSDIADVLADIGGEVAEAREVTVFGAGRIGLSLARTLAGDRRLRVTMMEADADRARYVAEQLPDATVLHEEGVGEEALVSHGVDRSGAFIACAGDDRANLLAALHAKKIGAGLSLAVVSREEFVPLVDALAIDAAVSPRLVTAGAILRSLRGEHVAAMLLMIGGAEVLEVEAEPGSRADGRRVEQVDAMGHTHVTAVIRDGEVEFARPDLKIRARDRVIVFSPRHGL